MNTKKKSRPQGDSFMFILFSQDKKYISDTIACYDEKIICVLNLFVFYYSKNAEVNPRRSEMSFETVGSARNMISALIPNMVWKAWLFNQNMSLYPDPSGYNSH